MKEQKKNFFKCGSCIHTRSNQLSKSNKHLNWIFLLHSYLRIHFLMILQVLLIQKDVEDKGPHRGKEI